MKKIMSVISIFLSLVLLSSCSGGVGDTVASVDDESVSAGEVLYMMARNIEAVKSQMSSMTDEEKSEYWSTDVDGKKPVDIIRESSLEYLISYAAIVRAAKEEKITVSDKEVSSRLEGSYTAEELSELKENYGVTKAAVKSVLRKQLFQQKYVSRVLEKRDDYTPTEEQLMEDLKSNYYKARHILISKKDAETGEEYSPEKQEEARKKAENILKKIKNGGDFETLMYENTEDPGIQSYPDGYVFTEGEMIREFEEAVASLPENGISDIVETSYGYHIIKRLPVTTDDFADKETELINNYKSEYLDAFTQELKSKYEIKQDDAKLNEITVNTEF